MHHALSLGRHLVTQDPFISDPIAVYTIPYGWFQEVSFASKEVSSRAALRAPVPASFFSIDGNHLLSLLHLRRVRQEGMQVVVDNTRVLPRISILVFPVNKFEMQRSGKRRS